jgi:2,2-dialkylglycine decarboxylase (pyruvate)
LAAFITEPLFSAGGVIEPPTEWLPLLRHEADTRGALLILDESQTALGKLGTMWAFERVSVVPDILVLSKHLGGGIAISAVITTPAIERAAIANGFLYSHSHSSDPLGCAAALASLDIIEGEGVLDKALRIEDVWTELIQELSKEQPLIGDIRGRGVLHGVELRTPEGAPAFFLGQRILRQCERSGLLFSVRQNGAVLRFTIPFSASESVLVDAAGILASAIESVARDVDAGRPLESAGRRRP